jgi:hypothetical protein
MKKLLPILMAGLVFAFSANAQRAEPTSADRDAVIPVKGVLKRGAPIGKADKVDIGRLFAEPARYAGKPVRIEGVIVRSCKMEGCWAEVAADKDSPRSIRVQMKDHAFFIPLNSAGSRARVEGTVSVRTIEKAEVEHLMNDDGAKFPNINADGTVTELSFVATGIELSRD